MSCRQLRERKTSANGPRVKPRFQGEDRCQQDRSTGVQCFLLISLSQKNVRFPTLKSRFKSLICLTSSAVSRTFAASKFSANRLGSVLLGTTARFRARAQARRICPGARPHSLKRSRPNDHVAYTLSVPWQYWLLPHARKDWPRLGPSKVQCSSIKRFIKDMLRAKWCMSTHGRSKAGVRSH